MAVQEVFEYQNPVDSFWLPSGNGNGRWPVGSTKAINNMLQSYFLIGESGWQSVGSLSSVNSGELFVHGGEL